MLKIHSELLVQSGNMNVQNWKQNNKLKQVLQTCLLFLQTKTWVNNGDNIDKIHHMNIWSSSCEIWLSMNHWNYSLRKSLKHLWCYKTMTNLHIVCCSKQRFFCLFCVRWPCLCTEHLHGPKCAWIGESSNSKRGAVSIKRSKEMKKIRILLSRLLLPLLPKNNLAISYMLT